LLAEGPRHCHKTLQLILLAKFDVDILGEPYENKLLTRMKVMTDKANLHGYDYQRRMLPANELFALCELVHADLLTIELGGGSVPTGKKSSGYKNIYSSGIYDIPKHSSLPKRNQSTRADLVPVEPSWHPSARRTHHCSIS
jgi:hypothetical protein